MFEELTFGQVLRLTARVQQGTLPQQATLFGIYLGLFAVACGSFALMDHSVVFFLIAAFVVCTILATIMGISYMLTGVMAPRAVQIVSGEQEVTPAGVPWRRMISIVWASVAVSLLWSFLVQFFVLPGYVVVAALWAWPAVAACEPGAAGVSRAQQLVNGRKVKVFGWYMAIHAALLLPKMLALGLFIYAFNSVVLQDERGVVLILLLLTTPIVMAATISVQSSFMAAIYAVLRYDEDNSSVDKLLHVFE